MFCYRIVHWNLCLLILHIFTYYVYVLINMLFRLLLFLCPNSSEHAQHMATAQGLRKAGAHTTIPGLQAPLGLGLHGSWARARPSMAMAMFG